MPVELFKYVDLMTPNKQELQILAGQDGSLIDQAGILRGQGISNLIVTLGEKGAYISTKDKAYIIPAVEVPVVDTTGAGDAFTAALAVGLGRGYALEKAVEFATRVAANVITKLGAQTSVPTLDELDDWLIGKMTFDGGEFAEVKVTSDRPTDRATGDESVDSAIMDSKVAEDEVTDNEDADDEAADDEAADDKDVDDEADNDEEKDHKAKDR